MKRGLWSISLLAAVALTACNEGPKSGKGFRLPEGDAEKGQAAFVSLQCHTCHQVVGVNLPAPASKGPINIFIGGEVTKLRTYGDLVTAIINPAHGLAPGLDKKKMEAAKLSPMPEFNQVMTAAQMIDLVAFLHPRYKRLDPTPYYPVP
jgi:mono/diheme cytochrome c family protein